MLFAETADSGNRRHKRRRASVSSLRVGENFNSQGWNRLCRRREEADKITSAGCNLMPVRAFILLEYIRFVKGRAIFAYQNLVLKIFLWASIFVLHLDMTRHDDQVNVIFLFALFIYMELYVYETLWKIIKTSLQHDLIIYYVR